MSSKMLKAVLLQASL